jgi:hypothetical protein
MPINSSVDHQHDLTIFVAAGELTFEDQMAVLRQFYAGNPTKHVLWDFTRITGRRISAAQLRAIVQFIAEHATLRAGGKTALVGSSDVDFGLARMGSALSEARHVGWQMQAFRDLVEAREWITATASDPEAARADCTQE